MIPAAVIPAVPVPFRADGDLDVTGLGTLFRAQREDGVNGVFVAGTTGEFTALDDDERTTVFSAALEVFGPDEVYVHVGAAAARQAERLTAQAVAVGARHLAAITPYYLPAGERALIDYYRRLDAVADGGQLYAYLFPARTNTTVTPAQLAELAEIPSVVGAKISGLPTTQVLEYLDAVPVGFTVYTGNNIEFGEYVRAGGAGTVSAVASVFPEPFLALAEALRSGDGDAAAAAQGRVERATAAVGGADIALLKAGLEMRGLPGGPTRVAIDEPTSVQLGTLKAAVDSLA